MGLEWRGVVDKRARVIRDDDLDRRPARILHDHLVPVVEQPTEAERARYETGLVTEAIARRVADASACSAYLCGGPGMLNACCDVLSKTGLRSENVFFPGAENMRTLDAELDIRLHGNPVPQRQVKGYNEKFVGVSEAGHVQGKVSVATSIVIVRKTDGFPRQAPLPAGLEPFVAPGAGIESDQDVMKSKGEEVTWRSRTAWEATKKVNTWVHETMREGYSMPSARYVLDHGTANAEGRALLSAALLRSVRVPARVVGGVMFFQGSFVPHYWVEANVGEDGWVPVDPTTGEAGTLGATHIALWEHGDLMSMSVKVLDYGPRPPARVAFFNRELAWPVGQERVYSVQNGGKEIGRETARVVGIVRRDGKDVYQVDFSADVTLAGRRSQATARLLTDMNVLPVAYTTTQTIDTFVYRALLELSDVGRSSAAGFLQSILGFILVFGTNWLVKRLDKESALF